MSPNRLRSHALSAVYLSPAAHTEAAGQQQEHFGLQKLAIIPDDSFEPEATIVLVTIIFIFVS